MASGKKISQPMQELLEDDDVGGEGLGRKKKRQHERSGADEGRRERERSLPTTSAFRMIDRSHCSSGRWSLMISIGWESDPLLTLSSITSFPWDSHLPSCVLKRDMGNAERTARGAKCHLHKTKNYAKLFQNITLRCGAKKIVLILILISHIRLLKDYF